MLSKGQCTPSYLPVGSRTLSRKSSSHCTIQYPYRTHIMKRVEGGHITHHHCPISWFSRNSEVSKNLTLVTTIWMLEINVQINVVVPVAQVFTDLSILFTVPYFQHGSVHVFWLVIGVFHIRPHEQGRNIQVSRSPHL